MSGSILRSAFGRLPPVSRRDRRIRELEQRLEQLRAENARLERELASGDQLTRPSFRARIHAERRLRALGVQMGVPSTSVIRHGKFYVYDLARSHGIDVPEQYAQWDDPADIAWDELPELVVIKSAFSSTSRGVFPLRRNGPGWEVITHDTVMTADELTTALADLVETGRARPPFAAEEFLDHDGTGARLPIDVRVLSFYGEVPVVALRQTLEHGNAGTSVWRYVDRHGSDLLDEHPALVVDQTIPVPTALDELCESASRLSVAIRAPFSRIDMYAIGDRVVFGEVTPRPGGPQWFGPEVDRMLGDAWERAMTRLSRDVVGDVAVPGVRSGPARDTDSLTAVPEPLVDARNGHRPSLDAAVLGQALLETDRRYFELGARRRELTGAEMLWIEGMADLPAAGVVHRVAPAGVTDSAAWIGEVTAALLDAGFRYGRIYLDAPDEPLESRLAADGWTMRREPGLVGLAHVPTREPGVELVPVLDDDDWVAKEQVHRADAIGPDGHDASASGWVAMEKARVATGELEAWLVLRDGIVCGTVCSMADDVILRNKNLVVHPDHRRTGVGMGVLATLDDMARDRGLVLGTFSVAGEDGELLYRAANMSVVVEQREWSRPLEGT